MTIAVISVSSLTLVFLKEFEASALHFFFKKNSLYLGANGNWSNALLLLTVLGIWIQPDCLLVKKGKKGSPLTAKACGSWDLYGQKPCGRRSVIRSKKDGWIQSQVSFFLVLCNALKLAV